MHYIYLAAAVSKADILVHNILKQTKIIDAHWSTLTKFFLTICPNQPCAIQDINTDAFKKTWPRLPVVKKNLAATVSMLSFKDHVRKVKILQKCGTSSVHVQI